MASPSLSTLVERIWEKCEWRDCGHTSECLVFDGATARGYGAGSYYAGGGRQQSYITHRVMWEAEHGPIPDGLTIEHRCAVRACQNTEHMELMTRGDNTRAGAHRNPTVIANKAKTHCPQNHPYDEENTYLYGGGRYCRACGREARKRYYHKRKASA